MAGAAVKRNAKDKKLMKAEKISAFKFNPYAKIFVPTFAMEQSSLDMKCENMEQTDPDLLQNICHIDLIWNNITSHLNHTHLKSLSQVNIYFFNKVRNSPSFINISKYKVNCEMYDAICKDEPKFFWKNVDLIEDDEWCNLPYKKIIRITRARLYNTEVLGLHAEMGFKLTREILSNSKFLKSLTLSGSILGQDLRKVFSQKSVQICFGNLEELHISDGNLDLEHDSSSSRFEENLKSLASISMEKLISFTWGKIHVNPARSLNHMTHVVTIIQRNCETLRELSLHLFIWRIKEIQNIVCPVLKNLTISARCKNEDTVRSFLDKQPVLEYFKIEFIDFMSVEFLDVIKMKGKSIRRLFIKCESFSPDDYMDWSVFDSMMLLEEFEVNIKINELIAAATLPQALMGIPANRMQKLTLRNLCPGEPMQVFCQCECMVCGDDRCHCICQCGKLRNAKIIAGLDRFSSLTELNLLSRHSSYEDGNAAVDDDVLQFICNKFGSKLRVLRISYCPRLTDYGLTGLGNGHADRPMDSGVSLRDLSGLRELAIKGCKGVTEQGLLLAVKFVTLIRANLDTRKSRLAEVIYLHDQAMIEIVKQNPNLETLVMYSPNEDMVEALKAANSSLVKVYNTYSPEWLDWIPLPPRKVFDEIYDDPLAEEETAYEEDEYESSEEIIAHRNRILDSSDDDEYYIQRWWLPRGAKPLHLW